MKLRLMPFFLGAAALVVSVAPIRVRAEESSHSSYSVSDSAQPLNLNPQQQLIVSALNLSSRQEAQLQHIEQPPTFHHVEPVLTPGQRKMWFQMRHSFDGR